MNDISIYRDKYRVTELDHSFRVNGVIDIWKNGHTIYDIVENKYHNIHESAKHFLFCSQLLEIYQERPDFKPTKKGRITYQELKNTIKRQEHEADTIRPEDYQWRQHLNDFSDDHLYFLIHDNNVKIGRTSNPVNRFNVLKTSLSDKAKMYVFFNKGFLEPKLHACLSDLRKQGEWFSGSFRLSHFIKKYHIQKSGSIIQTRKTKHQSK